MISFTVYENPKDYPGKWVVRRFVGLSPDQDPVAVGDSQREVREKLLQQHPQLACFSRRHDDDPVIVETWL